jgi:sugar phosphate isomerase/epimerase
VKLAFSTLGVPGLPVADVARLAADHGFHGVELRTEDGEPVDTRLTAEERSAVTSRFSAADVEILAAATSVEVAAAGDDETVLEDIRAHLTLAADMGASFVRVFPGGTRATSRRANATTGRSDMTAARRLAAVAPFAADLGVRVLLETHDSHATGAAAARILGEVGHRSVGAVWDVMHTWLGGEQPSASYRALAPYLGYVRVKDIASADDTTPQPLGAGAVPLAETVEVLSRADWDGWLCWEYEKHRHPWAPELPALLGSAGDHLSRLLADSA